MKEDRFLGPAKRFAETPGAPAEKFYGQMQLIRRFEQVLLERFENGEVSGTTHACIGQEADAVGVLNHLGPKDVVFSNHRCHGHFLVYSDRPELLAAEVMGRAGGMVRGRGGSQHICWQSFYSNGIQGGIVPVAVGMGLAEKYEESGAISVVFLGDGTLGEGVVYEALNMASLWSAPVLFVVEDNRWAQSTPVEKELAGDMAARARAFDIEADELSSTDVEEIYEHFEGAVDAVRRKKRPRMEIIHTYRLCHHSKSDDMRPRQEVEKRWEDDPLALQRDRLDADVAQGIDDEIERRIKAAFDWAAGQPMAGTDQIVDPVAKIERES